MATIPQIVTSPGAVPGTPSAPSGGGLVRASPQMDVRAPSDPSAAQAAGANIEAQALESTARSADKVAQYGEQFADTYVKAKLNIDAANRTADLSAQLHEAEFESSKIPERDAAAADFDARAAKIRDDFAAKDVNPRVRAAVDASLPNQIALRRASTQQAAFGLWAQAQVGSLITNIDQYGKQAIDAQDPRLTEQLIAQANAAIDGRVEGGALKADVAAKMKVDFGSSVYRTKIEIAMAKDMRSGIALFEATKGKLNAQDLKIMTNVATDRSKQVDAEATVSTNMPQMGGGTGGDVGAVQADAEKTLGFSLKASGDRTVARNTEVDGAKDSQHLQPGKAIDIDISGLSEEQKAKLYAQILSDPRVGGIGFYTDGHLHVDTRGGPRQTWGKPPPAIAEMVGVWQSTASTPAGPSGDQHAQTRIAQFQYRQSIINNLALDPEAKARQLSIIDQRMGTQNSIVLEQRKSADDAAEAASIALGTGKYKTGTFQQTADQYRATGDNSKADAMQVLADNEAQLIEDAKNPPEQRSAASMLLPGAGGRIAAQQSAEKKADIVEARRLVAQARTDYLKASAEQEKIYNEVVTAGGDPRSAESNMKEAIGYAYAAGDYRKAKALEEQYLGGVEGSKESKLPPAQRERRKRELEEQIKNQQEIGLPISRAQAEALKIHAKGVEANRQLWENNLLVAAEGINAVQLQPFDINMPQAELQVWGTKRLADLRTATARIDGNTNNLRNNFFTVDEMSALTQKLDRMKPQEAQAFLARLAVAVPADAINAIGQQMSKKDAVSDSYAAAIGLYANPANREVADRVIFGMNLWQKGGEDGKTRVDVKDDLFVAIDSQLKQARAGMSPDTIRMQNNAIIANYIAKTANAPDRKSIKTPELNDSITEIVGRVMPNQNGATTIIPRDLEPYQVRNGVAAITPADVANLRPTAQGQPVTAEVVRQNGQLVPAGDGRYKVVIPDPLAAGRGHELIDNNTGQPWIVDIRPLIARGVRSEGSANQPDPMRPPQSVTPTLQPLVPKTVRPGTVPGGAAP